MFYNSLIQPSTRANVILLAKREIQSRIIGTYLGWWHYLFIPMIMLAVYTFVFGFVFKVQWPGDGGSHVQFALKIFVGLIQIQFVTEILNRAPGIVLENPSYVKKIAFPLETLVPISILVAAFAALISLIAFMAAFVATGGILRPSMLWVVIFWPSMALLTLGCAWGLAALGVYLRDLRHFVAVATSALIFLSPVFYPMSSLPEAARAVVQLNPMAFFLESTRGAFFDGAQPALSSAAFWFIVSIAAAQGGYWVFMRTRRGFGDVV